jgi:hypothetical protein
MNLRFWNYAGLLALILISRLALLRADEPPRLPGAPIVFSAPKSDSVATNLNQPDSKASPFKGLESDLKKPFQIFDAGRSDGSFRPPASLTDPPAAPATKRRIKELMDKRADMMLLDPDRGDLGLDGEDPRKAAEDPLDAAGEKLKTPLDRYYRQLDRERSANTNQTQNSDIFDKKNDPDARNSLGLSFTEHPFDSERKAAARSLGRMSNNAVDGGGFFSENFKPKEFYDLADDAYQPPQPERNASVKDMRLDEFKRLLGEPANAPRNHDYSPSLPAFGTAPRPATPALSPSWSLPSAPAAARDSFTSRAGLVGAPPQLQSLPSFGSTTPGFNSAPAPVAQPKPPTSTFSLPKRQF